MSTDEVMYHTMVEVFMHRNWHDKQNSHAQKIKVVTMVPNSSSNIKVDPKG